MNEDAMPGFLALLRQLERTAPDKPRIGRAERTRDEVAALGQDPFLTFPDAELTEARLDLSPPRVRPRVMGFYGPQGALPLTLTEEVLGWVEAGDRAFVDFTDIFATRFIGLLFRAWSDARAIGQFDHPDDRFQKYLLSFAGLGTPAFRDQSDTVDTLRLRNIGLFVGRVRSPVRLRQMLELHLKADVSIEEMVPAWMEFEPDSLSRLGMQGSTLGQNIHLGRRILSIGEKIRIHIRAATLESYRRFLPGGPDHTQVKTVVQSYLGMAFEVDVALWLPQREVEPTVMGKSGQLGWMACVAPPGEGEGFVKGTNFRLALAEVA
ncbi:type VI secretion system baseplate subunit TssG [Tabrizicola aquatica]|uniref:type VI secretion system baseplate subunit TssG n=1 Tax=Tabrizicola aquatica TaxID=909926 RepID=UPI0015E19DCF|nr:type VI secretion system baseplate subunit TssG [Tabrizicola aquatica]